MEGSLACQVEKELPWESFQSMGEITVTTARLTGAAERLSVRHFKGQTLHKARNQSVIQYQ